MQRHKTQSIAEAIVDYLREMGLEKPLAEQRVIELWPEVLGPTVARYTREITVERGMLRVRIINAALRQQLFECRFELVKKLNDTVGAPIINDIRLFG